MICPKCGKELLNTNCSCGIDVTDEQLLFIGKDLDKQIVLISQAISDINTSGDPDVEDESQHKNNHGEFGNKPNETDDPKGEKVDLDSGGEKEDPDNTPKTENKQSGNDGHRRWPIFLAGIIITAFAIGLFSGLLSGKNNKASNDSGWGDSDGGRPSYTIAEINNGVLGDTITFNSISDGEIGDEKNFVAAKVSDQAVSVWNADTIKVRDGEKYTIRLWVHNNNPQGQEAIAENVRATFNIPKHRSKEQTIQGFLNSSNAKPSQCWDGVTLVSDNDFLVEYIFGSARFNNNELDEIQLSDDIVSSGTMLGYQSLDGNVPGCYEYAGVVTIDIAIREVGDKETWGPQNRKTFTWENPASYATLNSITDNPVIGDERNFVRIKEADSEDYHLDDVDIEGGKEYELYVFYHNNASASTKDKAIAENVALRIEGVGHLEKGQTGMFRGILKSSNADPQVIWDSAFLYAKEDVKITYIQGSAIIHTFGETDGEELNIDSIFGNGALFSPNKDTPGVIPSTEEGSRGYITLRIKAESTDSE